MSIYLDKKSYQELRKNEVGSGSDGAVFRYNRHELIKIYHKKIENALLTENSTDKDIKLYSKENIKNIKKSFEANGYIDEFGIKIYNPNIIKKAIKLQPQIKLSSLPKDDVYYNGIFVGCVINYCKGIGIHKLMGLPIKQKLFIMEEVIERVEELLNYNIYCTDICNSPFARDKSGQKNGHSHILVDILRKKISLIDLEGQSTIYTDKYSKKLYDETIKKLNILFIEFVFSVENFSFYDYDELMYLIRENYGNINTNLDRLVSLEMSLDETKQLVKNLKN